MKSPNISDLIDAKTATLTSKVLDYYDGKQESHLIKLLNDPNKGRKDWQSRGIIPRTRNILKMVVEKSGLLFNDKAPRLDVYSNGAVDELQSAALQAEFEKLDWVEFFTNFDSVVRMLKSACILVQYDPEEDQLIFDMVTQKDGAVVLNKAKKLDTFIYRVYGDEDSEQEFRVFTKDLIQDIRVDEHGKESIIQSIPNPFGMIPLVVFHDTNTPRCEFWNEIPTDLLNVNDMYNLHITDSEYAASWSKLKTLFTNARIEADIGMTEEVQVYGSALPRTMASQGGLIGGPSRVIQIDTTGVDSAFVEYKGPEVNLEPIDNMFNKWVADFAADWAVNVKDANGGAADSGFKLIVEEMPNLELRKKRARMFEAGFKRLFKVVKRILNANKPGTFSEDAELFAQFSAPALPVDLMEQENIWSRRIQEQRASRVDYLIEVKGLTRDEALAKMAEIDSDNSTISAVTNVQKINVRMANRAAAQE